MERICYPRSGVWLSMIRLIGLVGGLGGGTTSGQKGNMIKAIMVINIFCV
jgi:hypothetical protein